MDKRAYVEKLKQESLVRAKKAEKERFERLTPDSRRNEQAKEIGSVLTTYNDVFSGFGFVNNEGDKPTSTLKMSVQFFNRHLWKIIKFNFPVKDEDGNDCLQTEIADTNSVSGNNVLNFLIGENQVDRWQVEEFIQKSIDRLIELYPVEYHGR